MLKIIILLLALTIAVTPAYAINTTEFTIIDSIRNDGTACLGFVNLPAGSTSVSLLYNGNSQNTTHNIDPNSDIFTDGMTCQSGMNNRLAGEYQYYAGGSGVYSNAIVLSEYKHEPPTLSGSVTVSTQSGNTYTEQVPQEPLIPDISVDVTDNEVTGNVGTEDERPVAVTTISPSFESTTTVTTPDSNGDYKVNLNPSEEGEHRVLVTHGEETVSTTYDVKNPEVNLEIRLQILQTLESILKIIFGNI